MFVSNIPFEISEQQFFEHFKRFGVYYARLVKSPGSDLHKGTGFVKFKKLKTVQHLLDLQEKVEQNPE